MKQPAGRGLALVLATIGVFWFGTRGRAEALAPTNPPPPAVTLRDFKLVGELADDQAVFTLTATAVVEAARGGVLEALAGEVALTDLPAQPRWRVRAEQDRFALVFDRRGTFPVRLQFHAAVRQSNGWSAVSFRVAPGLVQPIHLRGLAADTQFQFPGAARPERAGEEFVSYLPASGAVNLAWKQARKAEEGKLFYSAEMLSQISVSPGLMSQVALLEGKIMQGEMTRLTLLLRGSGEVTRVQGEQVLAWQVEARPGAGEQAQRSDLSDLSDMSDLAARRLVVQFNQPQKEAFALQVHMQTPLGAFPQAVEALQLRPEGATRFAGCFRIVNDGAVRLEVVQAAGLSQISPEQFPESEATRAAFRPGGSQRFAYRFSGPEFALRIQADQILPELTVSEVLAYHLGENELAIDAEIELDVREAPLRELLLRVPRGYAVARLNVAGLSDYFTREPEDAAEAELRLVWGQPVSGRQVIQLRLERNQPLGQTAWTLPRVEVLRAKSVRGHVGVSAEAGFRLTAERTEALTEIATAFFPGKPANIQAAFRLSDPAWQATLRVERLPQTVQADVFHLFSIGEGIAYGSSVMNYLISGAPLAVFRVELSDEYFNVEFTGKDLRNWQKTTNGYLVTLHTPVAGPYTLLATYERPFKARGDTLAFTGARPADAQNEQGHTLLVSAYPFQIKPEEVSPGLLPLEPGEVPAEYRLFFDAPVLAAYRYNARPFGLRLALSPLAQGETLSQVVDRAALVTRISKEGQVLTEARYFVKNRGHPHFRLTLPEGVQLWSATVNGAPVVPVADGRANLLPLPQQPDPNAVLALELKLAERAKSPERVAVAAPVLDAPVLLAEWTLLPDTGRRLVFRKGSLTPAEGVADVSGFAQLARLFSGPRAGDAGLRAAAACLFVLAALVLWRWAGGAGGRRKADRWAGLVLGGAAAVLAAGSLWKLATLAAEQAASPPPDVTLLAPVQQAGNALTVEVENLKAGVSAGTALGWAWPAALALLVWGYGRVSADTTTRRLAALLGWLLLLWAALRCAHGAALALAAFGLFLLLHVFVPTLRLVFHALRDSRSPDAPPAGPASAPAVAMLLLTMWHCGFATAFGATPQEAAPTPAGRAALTDPDAPRADSLVQEIRVEDGFALATARVRWQAVKGRSLPVLFEPAVLTGLRYPSNTLRLVQQPLGGTRGWQLLALGSGVCEVELTYQFAVQSADGRTGIVLPTRPGLINRVTLTLVNLDVDVRSPAAVSVRRQADASNTVATLVLAPAREVWIGWQPRTRDVKREKPVFYAELTQLYAPSAGVIEGVHRLAVRPAQGELGELVLTVPAGMTITDVRESSGAPSLWQFDPDRRRLRVTRQPPESRPFTVMVRSQVATGLLPYQQTVGLLSVEGAAGQIGLLGLATGNEAQLDAATAEGLSPINLEDFPGEVVQALAAQIPGLTVRRAFRYADARATAWLKASAVEPDVRVETQETLSLGEDRLVLAANATVTIARAGIFRLSFVLPPGLDVESVSGAALSHWTELKTDAGRVVTLHLKGKTEGQQQFAISLTGPGVRAAQGWAPPQLVFREAGKQQGTLILVPEQGLRLQVAGREGVTQLDPQRSGIRQKGVLVFRILQAPWRLALDLERVEPWIQVTSLQHATVGEAQVKVAANLQYQIENTGLKAFRVWLPTDAESVRFAGEQVADFLPVSGAVTNAMQAWEVKLHRRVLGKYLLQVNYQTALPDRDAPVRLRGVQAAEVNLQRGFVTVQSSGRLQVRVEALPAALQPAEWQSIPRALQQDLPATAAHFTWRLVDPAFELPLTIERHEAAKLLPARVRKITLTSVISDEGVMLTQARLEMWPGDKRLLRMTLPKGAEFWFAFVDQNGVWPWREQEQVLIPLEPPSRAGQPLPVDVFFSSRVGRGGGRTLDLALLAPKFDLPLEDITWRVCLSEKWRVRDWTGTLQLQEEKVVPQTAAVDVRTYLQSEAAMQRAQTREAEQLLQLGNTLLEKGDPQQARRAFQAAYGLSRTDQAFNEDARVQLNNLKLQQALLGLNVRQAAVAGEAGAVLGRLRDLRGRKEAAYTQADARAIIERNAPEENAAFMRLAERLIQQQDAAVSSPAALRASIPEQGRLLTFSRSVLVDPWADLSINLRARAVPTAAWWVRGLTLMAAASLLAGFGLLGRPAPPASARPGR